MSPIILVPNNLIWNQNSHQTQAIVLLSRKPIFRGFFAFLMNMHELLKICNILRDRKLSLACSSPHNLCPKFCGEQLNPQNPPPQIRILLQYKIVLMDFCICERAHNFPPTFIFQMWGSRKTRSKKQRE